MRVCALFLLALSASAQTYEVRGTVTEVGAGGIADVEVTVTRFEDGAAKKTRTDGQGVYRVTMDAVGVYYAAAAKGGYFGSGQPIVPLTLTAAQPQAIANMSFTRAGEVIGRLLDEESREPLPGVPVSLYVKQWNFGQLSLNAASREPVMTDAEGRFRFPNLRPAVYIASARPQVASTARLMRGFTPEDLAKTDDAFPATYWPGGGDEASAFGVTLTSGGFADIGSMFVRKTPQYRVQVTTRGDCVEGDAVRLSILRRNAGVAASIGDLPCNGTILLRGFDPDSYVLYAASERRNGELATSVSGVTSFVVVDKNLSATIALQRNIVIEGQLTVTDGSAAPRILPRITSGPFDLLPGARLETDTAIRWAPDQRHFQLAVSPRTQTLNVFDPTGAYVKEIRYNSAQLRSTTLPINPSSTVHKLEIVVDDKWGSLAATVTDGSRGVAAAVLIAKDGARLGDLAGMVRSTGSDGALSATQLAPGEYRVIAFAAAAAQRIHEADVLQRALSTAQRVTVSPGSTQTISIRLSDVR